MRIQIKIYSILLLALAFIIVKCYEHLTFLNDNENLPQESVDNSIIETGFKNNNFKADGIKAIPDYDMYVLAIQWGNTLCLSNNFCKKKLKSIRKNIMTLHGLWPSLNSGSSLPDCNSEKDVPVKITDTSLFNSMQAYWPSYTGPDDKFWTHEYNKHGLCYTNKSKTKGFMQYFMLSLDIFRKYNLESFLSQIVDGSQQTEVAIRTSELRAAISSRYPGIYYDFDCKKIGNKTYLAEIRIYFNLNFVSFLPPKSKSDCPASQPIYIPKYSE